MVTFKTKHKVQRVFSHLSPLNFSPLILLLLSLSAAAQQKSELPYRIHAEKMLVDVTVEGHACTLIFDTGGTTAFTDQFCQKAGLKEDGGNVTITDVTSSNKTYAKLIIDSFCIPGGNVRMEKVMAMHLEPNSSVERFGADGLLGSELLQDYIISIDSRRHIVTITSAETPVEIDTAYQVPFAESNNMWPVMTFLFGDRPVRTLFDTGAYPFLSLKDTDYYDLYSYGHTHLLERGFGRGPSGLGGSQVPRMEVKRIQMAPIHIGKAELRDAITDELTQARQTIIGLRLTEYGIPAIDYRRKLFWFVPFENPIEVKFEVHPVAFELNKKTRELVVSKVWGDLRHTIRLGDKVVSINGKPLEKYDTWKMMTDGIPAVTKKKRNLVRIQTKKDGVVEVEY